jgi:3-hydroxyisobutyrate dehydrogenase-like beta-hydroxyacid dehydrogenase
VTVGRALGFVGLGKMGHPMAANLVEAGFDVHAFDAAGTLERLPGGARACASVAEVAERSGTVLLSLPDGEATRTLATEITATTERRATTVIDLSTVGPAVAAEVAGVLADVGVTYADGPVSGGVAGARAATVSLMFAGPADVLDSHRGVLEAIAGSIFHVGTQPGQGQAMKLLNNFLSATALAATSEALAFGQAHGLDLAVMLDVLNVSSGRNSATADKFPNRVLTGTFDAGFRTALMAKDLRLYRDLLAGVGSRADVSRAVATVWEKADDALPGSDFTEIWTFVRDPPSGSGERTA